MAINLPDTYNAWLKTHINVAVDENTKFTMTIGSMTPDGAKDIQIDVDLVWFIILYVEDKAENKLPVIAELLKNPILLQRFKNTLDYVPVKRVLSEFLIFNYDYLDALKGYIDFTKLNMPLDFITYALFIKRGEGVDTVSVAMERLKTVNAVLDTGFKINPAKQDATQATVVAKVLLMEDVDSKFDVALRLAQAGFRIFGANPINDAACAVRLIDARQTPSAKALIDMSKDQFKAIKLRVAGSNSEMGNLADFYYWVREDMDAMHYVKDTFGLELTPST
jgi:hypothetical protein